MIPHAHTFFDPKYQATFEHIVAMDNLARAKHDASKSTQRFLDHLRQGQAASTYESVQEYAEHFDLDLTGAAVLKLNQEACKESARQQKEVVGEYVMSFADSVLAKVFQPVLEATNV